MHHERQGGEQQHAQADQQRPFPSLQLIALPAQQHGGQVAQAQQRAALPDERSEQRKHGHRGQRAIVAVDDIFMELQAIDQEPGLEGCIHARKARHFYFPQRQGQYHQRQRCHDTAKAASRQLPCGPERNQTAHCAENAGRELWRYVCQAARRTGLLDQPGFKAPAF